MTFDPNLKLHPQKRDELLSRPDVKQQLLIQNVITASFFAATLVYLWMVSVELLGPPAETDPELPLWYIFPVLAVSMVPMMVFMAIQQLKPLQSLKSGREILGKGQQLLIIELAIGEAVSVYGLICVFFGAPKNVQYGLIGFGILLMAVAVSVLRGKILDLALIRFAEEESNTETR